MNELQHLVRTLMFVAAGGLLLALGLGLFLARTALRPLEEVTNEIETVAETNDLGYRLDRGRRGRARSTATRLQPTARDRREQSDPPAPTGGRRESRVAHSPHVAAHERPGALARQELNPDDLRQLTDDMVTQVDELAALVTDLGELARGERSEGAVESLRLDECVDECVDTARTYARIKDITIDVDVETFDVLGRRDRLERAISNLLTNAVKFTPTAADRRRVRATARRRERQRTGHQRRRPPFIFDRFWRSASARALPGSGLGLSIVAQVVAELAGQRVGRPRPRTRRRTIHDHLADRDEDLESTHNIASNLRRFLASRFHLLSAGGRLSSKG